MAIAARIGVSLPTLRQYYFLELDVRHEIADIELRRRVSGREAARLLAWWPKTFERRRRRLPGFPTALPVARTYSAAEICAWRDGVVPYVAPARPPEGILVSTATVARLLGRGADWLRLRLPELVEHGFPHPTRTGTWRARDVVAWIQATEQRGRDA